MKLVVAGTLGCILSFSPFLSGCLTEDAEPSTVVEGSQAPSFSLMSIDGARIDSNALKGSAVVLNFWATWCQPCMTEIPDLKEVAANSKMKVIGIALDPDGVKTIKPFVARNNINYTVLMGDEAVFQRFNGLGIPYTLVIDGSQKIVKIYRGPTTKEALYRDLSAIDQRSASLSLGEKSQLSVPK
jgi:thiol-disulfide isomerase/thioredoxin